MKIYIVLKHSYWSNVDTMVFATADRGYAKSYCDEKNRKSIGYCHYTVRMMKLKEVGRG